MDIVTNIIFNIVDSLIIIALYTFFNLKSDFYKNNIHKCAVFILFYTLMLTITVYLLPQGIQFVFNILFVSLLLSFVTKTNLYASVITAAMIFIYLFTIEITVLFIFVIIFKTDMPTIASTLNVRILCGVISKTVEICLAIIILQSGIRLKKLSELKQPNTLIQLFALQTLMIAILILSLLFVKSYKSNFILFNIFIFAVYLFLVILTFIDYKERERLNAIQNRFKVQEEYINNMENILTIIRREKHDFANHLNTILAMCTLNNPDTVTKIGNYIRKLSIKLISAYHFYNSGNDYVDGMLAVKSNFAYEHNIDMEADFKASLQNILVNDCDITSIIGNITDNAFEAIISEDESEDKKVSISSYEDELCYYLSICNNGPVISDKDLNKIFNSGYSTKNNDKSDHGFGLYIVQQLVQRYNGIITVSSEVGKTEFLVKFFKDGKAYGKTG
jgi:Signal transduction histidine kinase regulating citrate/malate metabolism